MQKNPIPYWQLPEVIQHSVRILNSYQKVTGVSLFDASYSDKYKSYLLYHAPFIIVSHGMEADPVFNYANLMAQQLWVLNWEDFVQMPSRKSVEADLTEDRETLLATAAKKGYVDNYGGIRRASNGSRFRIEQVLLWNLMDEENNRIGQAAFFRKWTTL